MALLYAAELSPTKQEMLAGWVPTRPWSGGAGVDETLGVFRFDDADGEVGIETFLVRAGGAVLQVPVTYRADALPGADDRLITTTVHSVLGRRWVYDAVGDPVYVRELVRTIVTGAAGATLWVHRDGAEPERRDNPVQVSGSGDGSVGVPSVGSVTAEDDEHTSVVHAGTLRIAVARSLGTASADTGDRDHLRGTWPGQDTPVPLAVVLT